MNKRFLKFILILGMVASIILPVMAVPAHKAPIDIVIDVANNTNPGLEPTAGDEVTITVAIVNTGETGTQNNITVYVNGIAYPVKQIKKGESLVIYSETVTITNNLNYNVHIENQKGELLVGGVKSYTIECGYILAEQWRATEFVFSSENASQSDAIPVLDENDERGSFESDFVPVGWSAFAGGAIGISSDVARNGSGSLLYSGREYHWQTPALNIYDIVKENGAGKYKVSLWLYADSVEASANSGLLIRGGGPEDMNSFIKDMSGGNYFAILASGIVVRAGEWIELTAVFDVLATDLDRENGVFNLCLETYNFTEFENFYIDDLTISKLPDGTSGFVLGNSDVRSNFETASASATLADWYALWGGNVSITSARARSGNNSLLYSNRPDPWNSPAINLYPFLKENGAGTYEISFWLNATSLGNDKRVGFLIRTEENTFAPGTPAYDSFSHVNSADGNYYFQWSPDIEANIWTNIKGTLTVTEDDLARDFANYQLCFDTLDVGADQLIYLDDFTLVKTSENNKTIIGAGDIRSDFETEISYYIPDGWFAFGGGDLSIAWGTTARSGSSSLQMSGRDGSWFSPAINLYPFIKEGGAGTYKISLWAYVDSISSPYIGFLIRGNEEDINSFIDRQPDGNILHYLDPGFGNFNAGEWFELTGTLVVEESDLERAGGNFTLCIDNLNPVSGQNIYFDDFTLYKYGESILDVEFDAIFTAPDGTTMKMPGFWDGGDIYKIRFAPTMAGIWTYETLCSDTEDTGLHGKTGIFECIPYSGELDIYKHGFVQAVAGNRHFTYADNTPFFYLGDTHWSMPSEPFDTMFISIVDDRAAKGFTVYQSEPIGAQYNLSGGFYDSVLPGFWDLDRRFEYIANAGLVHANAELFFASELGWNRASYSDKYIEQLARYWVARYAAYPVMWTTAQEVDNDFYHDRDNPYFNADTNPWKIVFGALNKYDPYNHPATAHQEYATTGSDGTLVANSSFKDLPGHDWFASQWSPTLNGQFDFNIPKAYWDYGRIAANYEGRYENLWTKEFGARVQGWTAYLNGMFGASYGAVDIWLYNSDYDVNTTSNDGIDSITPGDKAVKWPTSMNFAASTQMGYMRNFLEEAEWWNLVPRFDDTAWFSRAGVSLGNTTRYSYYAIASYDDRSLYVGYFYNGRDNRTNPNNQLITGTFNNLLPGSQYEKTWFDPRTGEYGNTEIVTIGANGQHSIGNKPDANDWVVQMRLLP